MTIDENEVPIPKIDVSEVPVPKINISVDHNKVTFLEIIESSSNLREAFIRIQRARKRTTDLRNLPISDALVAVMKMAQLLVKPSDMSLAKNIILFEASEAINRLFDLLQAKKASTRQKIELCHLMLGMLVGKACIHHLGGGTLTEITPYKSRISVTIRESNGTEVDMTFFDETRQKVNECGLLFSAAALRRSLPDPFTKTICSIYYCTSLVRNPWDT